MESSEVGRLINRWEVFNVEFKSRRFLTEWRAESTTRPRLVHYDMESLLVGKLEDLAGRGSHAVLSGTSSVGGVHGGARDFNPADGTPDYATAGDMADFEGRSPFTIAAWFKREADNTAGWSRILTKEKWRDAQGNRHGWLLYIHRAGDINSNKIGFDRWSGNEFVSTEVSLVMSTTTTALNTWYHVAITYDGSSLRMYVNGLEEGTASATNLLVGHDTPLRVGTVSDDAGSPVLSESFDGVIDEVHLFNRALSSDEAREIQQGTEKGFYGKAYFDSLGRATRTVRRDLFGSLVSWDAYAYNFRDQVTSHLSPTGTTTTYEYDLFGRPTRVTYPGSAVLRPVGRGSATLWSKVGSCIDNWDCVDDASADGTVSYVETPTAGAVDYYAVQDLLHEGTVQSVTVTASAWGAVISCKKSPCLTNSMTLHTKVGTNSASSAVKTVGSPSPDAPSVVSHIWTTNPAGQPWTLADVNALEAGVGMESGVSVRVTRVEVTVDFGPSAPVTITYDDVNRIRTVLTENGQNDRKVQYLYDLAGRMTGVREYYDDVNYYKAPGHDASAVYTYDEGGNLLTVRNVLGQVTTHAYDSLNRLTRTTYPDHTLQLPREEQYTYDEVGNLLTRTDRAGSITTYCYDELDRLRRTFYQGSIDCTTTTLSPNVRFDFDEDGDIVAVASDSTAGGLSSTVAYAYDALGRVKTEKTTGLDVAYEVAYEYDAAGRVTLVRYPDGFETRYGYDAFGRPIEVTGDGRYAGFGYLPDDRIHEAYLWNGVLQSFAYTVRGWPASIKAFRMSLSYVDLSHSYDLSGNILGTGAASFTYDRLERLKTASGGFGSQTYTYDALGNRRQLDIGSASTTYGNDDGPTGTNQLKTMTQGTVTTSFGYDANGNLKTKSDGTLSWTYDWNFENLLKSAIRKRGATTEVQQTYAYDGLGRRIKVDTIEGTNPAKWTASIFSGGEVLFEKDQDGTTRKYIVAAGLRIAKVECPGGGPTCSTYFYLNDHLGSTRKVLSGLTTAFSTDYEPFGKPYASSGTEAYKFTGEKHDDPSTAWVYLRARQYDPEVGRFVSADPVLGVPALPQTLNRYTYVVNNPLKYTDPTGEVPPLVALAIILLVAGGIGVGVGVAQHSVPEIRPYTDPVADLVSFVPLVGDAYALGYYGAQGGLDCAAGRCDPVGMGINLGGSIPILGDVGKAVKYGGVGIGFFALVTKGGRHADDLVDAGRSFRPFTSRNFRHNFEEFTGLRPGKNFQAHHVLPQKFESRFLDAGINIHYPRFGAWVNARHHATSSYAYNVEWGRFFASHSDPSQTQILDFARQLSKRYHFYVSF